MAEAAIEEPAPAKLNLDLLVLGRRADGYHELDSLIAFTELGDRLRFEPADRLRLTVSGPFAHDLPEEPETNLVLRAAHVLAAHAGREPAAAIHLVKTLPVASGMGGGSADAAAALRGLNRLWGLGLDGAVLRELALRLGADVPACVHAQPFRLRGLGERLDPVRGLPSLPLVLLNPLRPLPTPRVFKALDPAVPRLARETGPPARPSPAQLIAWLGQSRNDLEPPAIRLEPLVDACLAALRAEPGCCLARMSGSGATCFGLFLEAEEAAKAAERLRQDHPGWWVAATGLSGG